MVKPKAPFRSAIIGSFIRPESLKEARESFRRGEINSADLREIEDKEIIKVVEKEKEAGIRAVTDGEFRRSCWNLDFMLGLEGIDKLEIDNTVLFKDQNKKSESVRVTGKISFSNHPMLRDFEFMTSIMSGDVIIKQTLPAPAQLLNELLRGDNKTLTELVYDSVKDLIDDISAAYRDAIRAFHDIGCRYIQFDDATWLNLCNSKFIEQLRRTGIDYRALAEMYAEVNTSAFEDYPKDMVIGLNACRVPGKKYVPRDTYNKVADILFKIPVDAFFVEFDNDKSGIFESLSYVENQKVVLGLINPLSPYLEDKEMIKRRIREAARYVPMEQICLSTQSGFAPFDNGFSISEEEQWKKVKWIVDISKDMWGEDPIV
ncbi:MAG: 5-methyltetrahydropteroyltriglutamate--homocysteine S-methyltransferase [Bacteroidaceae bacterium]|nr:5-methyltetrahydropteroyltriglutamate--homocysteine S-methyltransferase [Bacteroidaceae bacterium]